MRLLDLHGEEGVCRSRVEAAEVDPIVRTTSVLTLAILYQGGLADDGDNADRRILSVCVAEVQILTESKLRRLLEPVVDGDVIGVEVGAVMVVQDRIEPASQDWHMTRTVREEDSAAIGQFCQFDVEWSVYGFPDALHVRREAACGDENGHRQLNRMQIEYCRAAFVRDRVLPRLVGEQCEHIGAGDRPAHGSDSDDTVRCTPVELMQFPPWDQAVRSPALGLIAAVDNDY